MSPFGRNPADDDPQPDETEEVTADGSTTDVEGMGPGDGETDKTDDEEATENEAYDLHGDGSDPGGGY